MDQGVTPPKEYLMIRNVYGNRCAERSKVPLMNHIDEGLMILNSLGADEDTMKAWCLHPILQSDEEYTQNIELYCMLTSPWVLALTLEYRYRANNHLSHDKVERIGQIELSTLPQVNKMLIADKVQNYKDFMIHHAKTHPRRDELDHYFRWWLGRLGIDNEQFVAWNEALHVGVLQHPYQPTTRRMHSCDDPLCAVCGSPWA